MKELQQKIGYEFKNTKLLKKALTHSSFANESREKGLESNERLEFLGDSILGFIVAKHLFENYAHIAEGELTKARAALVCEVALYNYSKKLDLGKFLYLGKGEKMSNGRARESILADAFEALLAAIFLDGGMEEATRFALGFVSSDAELALQGRKNKDYKTELQEIVQQNKEETLEYVLVSEEGPAHARTFAVEVHLNSNIIGSGTGRSKKEAEQQAAKEALKLMGEPVE